MSPQFALIALIASLTYLTAYFKVLGFRYNIEVVVKRIAVHNEYYATSRGYCDSGDGNFCDFRCFFHSGFRHPNGTCCKYTHTGSFFAQYDQDHYEWGKGLLEPTFIGHFDENKKVHLIGVQCFDSDNAFGGVAGDTGDNADGDDWIGIFTNLEVNTSKLDAYAGEWIHRDSVSLATGTSNQRSAHGPKLWYKFRSFCIDDECRSNLIPDKKKILRCGQRLSILCRACLVAAKAIIEGFDTGYIQQKLNEICGLAPYGTTLVCRKTAGFALPYLRGMVIGEDNRGATPNDMCKRVLLCNN